MKRQAPGERAGRDRWLLSYADLVTLLLACFATTWAAAHVPAVPLAPAAITPLPAAVESRPAAVDLDVPPPPPASLDEAQAPLQPALRELLAPLLAMALGNSHVTLDEDRRGLVVSLPESATFATGSATLTSDARLFLQRFAKLLDGVPADVRVEGHTDDVPVTGRYASNWELSTARAAAVVTFLITETGFEPARLSAAGYGEFHPRVPNDTPERRALNRRVDLVVTNARRVQAPAQEAAER